MTNSLNSNKTYETSALCTTCQHSEVCMLKEEYLRILTTITQPTDCPFTVELKCPHHRTNVINSNWYTTCQPDLYYNSANPNQAFYRAPDLVTDGNS